MRKTLYFLLFVLFGVSLQAQTLLDTAQNFTVKDPYGNTLHLFDILDEGKIVVIDFFSTS
ncbi:MAG: hypothetical protein R2764_12390 [Bacteroidales bacterium]